MRILFLSGRFCYPLLKGDAARVYHQVRILSQDHSITLLSGAEQPVSDADYGQVAALCERLVVVPFRRPRRILNLGTGLFSRRPLQVSYYRSSEYRRQLASLLKEGNFDLIHVSLIRVAPYAWDLTTPPVVVDLIDSLGLNLHGRRTQVSGLKRLAYELEYRRMVAYERAAVARFPVLLVTSQADADALGGGDKVRVLPMGVDLCRFKFHGFEGRDPATLVFTGNMGYHPNEEAVLWFAREVWPRVKEAIPQARWQIVGANPGSHVREIGRSQPGVEVLGRVPDIAEHLGRATLAVCPVRSGSGIQMKVQEAMATGTPVVATSTANRGVGARAGSDLIVSDDPGEFAAAVSTLLGDSATRARLGEAGRAFVEQNFSWEQHGRELSAIYASLSPAS